MARIEFVDQSLRDGQQSLWGMRMQAGHILPVADAIDGAGYRVVDLTGSSVFEVLTRYLLENPWKGLDRIRAALPNSTLRAGTRTIGVVGMGVTPDSVVELWVRTLGAHGIDSMWIFDCLHDTDKMCELARKARSFGIAPSPQIMFSESPVHTDEHYADILCKLAAEPAVETIILGDEAGVMGPERARRLIRVLRERAPDAIIEMHFHNKTGMAPLNHIIGVEEGLTIVHSAVESMANGPSMPSTAVSVDNLRRLGHEITIDPSRLAEVSDHLGGIADDLGYERGAPVEYNVATIQSQFPGGMMGTLRNQLKQYGMGDRLAEVLEESIRVREEYGYPIMATPFSQLVGIQALLNIVNGERYTAFPEENLMYLAGQYGPAPGPVDQDVLDRALTSDRGRQVVAHPPPQPTIEEIRTDYGPISDEELILRYLIAGPDVDAMYAADNPIEPIFPKGSMGWVQSLMDNTRARSVDISAEGLSVSMRR